MNVLLFFLFVHLSLFFWLLVSTTFNFFVYVYASSLLFSCFVYHWYGSLTRFYHLARATHFRVCVRAFEMKKSTISNNFFFASSAATTNDDETLPKEKLFA